MRAIIRLAVALLFAVGASSATALTYTVVTGEDSGRGSLRQAILQANAGCLLDPAPVIVFNIPADRPRTIRPLSPLPAFDCADVSYAPTVSGETQPGWEPNTSVEGFNAVLPIVIDGSLAGTACGLRRSYDWWAGFSAPLAVRGLEIRNFDSAVVLTPYTSAICGPMRVLGSRIIGNYVGLAPVMPSVIGDATLAGRNVISGSRDAGIYRDGATRLEITNNLIGTDDSGTRAFPNRQGIFLNRPHDVSISGNVIAGNTDAGIWSSNVWLPTIPPTRPVLDLTLSGNRIGVGAGGVALGNGVGLHVGESGVVMEGTTVAHNRSGIVLWGATALALRESRVHLNLEDEIHALGADNNVTMDFGTVGTGGISSPFEVAATLTWDDGLATARLSPTAACAAEPICGDGFNCAVTCFRRIIGSEPYLACELAAEFAPITAGARAKTVHVCLDSISISTIQLTGYGIDTFAPPPDPPPAPDPQTLRRQPANPDATFGAR
jgi:hypothetical protein